MYPPVCGWNLDKLSRGRAASVASAALGGERVKIQLAFTVYLS